MKQIKVFALLFSIIALIFALAACGSCSHTYENGVCPKCGETETSAKTETESVSATDTESQLESVVNTESDTNIESDAVTDSEFSSVTDSEYANVTDSESAGINEGESDSETNSETAVSTENESASATESESAPISDTESEPAAPTETESVENTESETESTPTAPCEHSFENGVCTACGATDPDFFPADAGISLYDGIIEDFKYLILYKYMNEELPPRGDNDPLYMDALYEVGAEYTPATEMGYSFKDIDRDGYAELLLIGRDSRIYAMFTVKDGSAALVSTFQKGMGYLSPDGIVFYNVKEFDDAGGQIYLGNHIKNLVNGELVGLEYGWIDNDKIFSEDDDSVYYYALPDGDRTEVSKEEYQIFRDTYDYIWSYPTRLTRLSGLQFHPTLLAGGTPTVKADFSSYDSIISTFAYMHSTVAGGRYVRSDWISGDYDYGMIFDSAEDHDIYNRLIGACVLVQNNSKAVFGYAQKDLNGDGVDELILLESKFYVLAIFTQIDGEAVLVDSFTDLRTACIDANGTVHVKERTIPGYKKDARYTAYKIGAGEIIATTVIGVRCDKAGNATDWYKVTDGATTYISQAEYDSLYAACMGDIGTADLNDYTELNSGLVFVQLPTVE